MLKFSGFKTILLSFWVGFVLFCEGPSDNSDEHDTGMDVPSDVAIPDTALPAISPPLFSLPGGTYSSDISVEITSETVGVTLYYTTDGTPPDANSPVYEGPISISGDSTAVTLKAIATGTGYQSSEVNEASYYIKMSQVSSPQFTPTHGVYSQDIEVEITAETAGTLIYYTVDGSAPDTSSILYEAPIPVSGHQTSLFINAIAYKEGLRESDVVESGYQIDYDQVSTPQFDPVPGSYITDQQVTISSMTAGASLYYTLDGSDPDSDSIPFTGPILIDEAQSPIIIRAIALKDKMEASTISEATYVIRHIQVGRPYFIPSGGRYTADIDLSMFTTPAEANIYYTLDGSYPTPYSAPVRLAGPYRTYTITAYGTLAGATDSPLKSDTYLIKYPIKYWTKTADTAGFSKRWLQASIEFNGALWLHGGNSGDKGLDNAYASINGAVWFENGTTWEGQGLCFGPRYGHTTLIYNGLLWLFGGYQQYEACGYPGGYKRDVWSFNGYSWTKRIDAQNFGSYGAAVATDGTRIWMTGGSLFGGSWNKADVYMSLNGVAWTKMNTENVPYGPRQWHKSLYFNNSLWVIGGYAYLNNAWKTVGDVWRSDNGATWTQVTGNQALPDRRGHAAVTYNGKMWVIAGYGKNYENTSYNYQKDVYWSNNGMNWYRATDLAVPNTARRYYQAGTADYRGMWVIGGVYGSVYNDVYFSNNGLNWTRVLDNHSQFDSRYQHTIEAYNGMIWVIGGYTQGGLDDGWTSTDGTSWQEFGATWMGNGSDLCLGRRYGHAVTFYNDKLWLIGGRQDNNVCGNDAGYKYDIWQSSDGKQWVRPEEWASVWTYGASLLVYNNRMWLTGGLCHKDNGCVPQIITNYYEVRSSTDGVLWYNLAPYGMINPPFGPRVFHQTLAYDDRMWLIGGSSHNGTAWFDTNDVWSATSGDSWTPATSSAAFSPRRGFKSFVYDDKMWIIGGCTSPSPPPTCTTYYNDVWYSTDGVTWVKAGDADFTPRAFYSTAFYDEKIWVLGGRDLTNAYTNDVWYTD